MTHWLYSCVMISVQTAISYTLLQWTMTMKWGSSLRHCFFLLKKQIHISSPANELDTDLIPMTSLILLFVNTLSSISFLNQWWCCKRKGSYWEECTLELLSYDKRMDNLVIISFLKNSVFWRKIMNKSYKCFKWIISQNRVTTINIYFQKQINFMSCHSYTMYCWRDHFIPLVYFMNGWDPRVGSSVHLIHILYPYLLIYFNTNYFLST